MKNYLDIDYLIVYAFLAITLVIGILAGSGIKDMREYAIANKMYGVVTLTLTFLATNIGSSYIFLGAGEAFSKGIINAVATLGFAISSLIVALLITPKILYFDNCVTMGDVMRDLYGRYSQVIAGIIGLLYSVALIGTQFSALKLIATTLLNIKSDWFIVITGLLLTLYTAHGGIKSVAVTDVFQFIVIIVVIPLLANTVLNHVGGVQQLFASVPIEKFQIFTHEEFTRHFVLFVIWGLFPSLLVSPAIFQRLLMAGNSQQLRNQYLTIAAFKPLFSLVIMLIGLGGFVLYPACKPDHIVHHIIQELLPIGAKGLAIAGLIAVIMSTADSYLHTAGLLVAHDVVKPLFYPFQAWIHEIKWARLATILIGLAGIRLSQNLQSNDQIRELSFWTLKVASPVLFFPLVFGIIGLKPDKKFFYGAFVMTLIGFSIYTWLLPWPHSYLAVPLAIITNGITFLGLHIIQNKGLAIVEREGAVRWRPKRKSILAILKQWVPTPKRIINYSQNSVYKYGAPYTLFGVFFTMNYVFPYFMWAHNAPQVHDFLFILRLVGGILCALLIVQEKWPQSLRPYLSTYWHLTVLYCLPFMGTMMFLLVQGSTEWLINIAINIVLLFVLVDWLSALLLGVAGIAIGWLCYNYFGGGGYLPLDFSTQYLLVYQLVFGVLIGLIFARRKQQVLDSVASQRDYFKERQAAASNRLMEAISYQKEMLKELTDDQAAILDQATAAYLKQAIYRTTDYLRLEVSEWKLDQLLTEVIDTLKLQGYSAQPLIKKYTKVEVIQADGSKLRQVLLNSLNYLQRVPGVPTPIVIGLEDATLAYALSYMEGYKRKLEALKFTITTERELPATEAIYMIEPAKFSTWISRDQDDFPLIDNACIIDAHYGYVDVSQATTHVYVIPINVRAIRGKSMELLREPAAVDAEEAKHPLGIQLEKELLDKLAGTKVDLQVIRQALATAKKYHGGVRRKSGEPFFTHPMQVALILLEHSQDQDAIVAALLHDTVEDTNLSIAHIRVTFGETVASLVAEVTNLEDKLRRISLESHENHYRLLHCKDPRAALVKLSDRLHNMRTIQGHPSVAKKKKIAHETLTFFVPMASMLQRVGIAQELEKLSLAVLGK